METKELAKAKESIIQLIARGKIDESLKELEQLIDKVQKNYKYNDDLIKFEKEVIMLKARSNYLEERVNKAIISIDAANRERNRLVIGSLSILDEAIKTIENLPSLTLDVNFSDFSEDHKRSVEKIIRQITNNENIEISAVKKGSSSLILENLSKSDALKLALAIESGELMKLLGIEDVSVSEVKFKKKELEDSTFDDDKTNLSDSKDVKDLKIFLASSSELRDDRDAFELYFRQQNDRLRTEKGIYLQVVRWENFLDAMSETRLQDEYNKAIQNCDIFISLFFTKTGKYTEEEFDVAHQSFKEKKKPLIYTFFLDSPINSGDISDHILTLLNFKKKLDNLGHFYTNYSNIEDLKLKFNDQLNLLLDELNLVAKQVVN